MNDSEENCKQMLPPQTTGVALQSILIDESVSDSQIDMIDDADPKLKQNDQVKINPIGSTPGGNSTIFESSRIYKNKRNQDERSSTENSPESAKKSRKNDPANLSELCDSLESLEDIVIEQQMIIDD